jgi:hypothetical protein
MLLIAYGIYQPRSFAAPEASLTWFLCHSFPPLNAATSLLTHALPPRRLWHETLVSLLEEGLRFPERWCGLEALHMGTFSVDACVDRFHQSAPAKTDSILRRL